MNNPSPTPENARPVSTDGMLNSRPTPPRRPNNANGNEVMMISHWQKSQVRRYFCCCTADSQAYEDQNQLNNNLIIDELETFAND